ncbi:MAG: DUF3617 family protein [Caulobacter sp.]|nr:DUF3617 family protein [Caulobacter sp.]
MTRATFLAAGGVALLLALGACSKKTEDAAPTAETPAAAPAVSAGVVMKPTPGRWKMTTTMAGLPAGAMPAIEVCLTADDLKDDTWATGARKRPDNCSQMETKVSGGRVTTHAVCASEGITTTMDMTASGDFSRRYTVETEMRMSPAAPGAPNPMKMSVVAERLGDCQAAK